MIARALRESGAKKKVAAGRTRRGVKAGGTEGELLFVADGHYRDDVVQPAADLRSGRGRDQLLRKRSKVVADFGAQGHVGRDLELHAAAEGHHRLHLIRSEEVGILAE